MATRREAFENLLFNNPILSFSFGVLVYLPLMLILFGLFLLQLLVSIFLTMIAKAVPDLNQKHKVHPVRTARTRGTTGDSNPCSVSILQFNAFCFFGRFWTRKPLIEDMIRALSPDIISVNEAIRSRIWKFGTVQMISNLFDDHFDSVVSSAYDELKVQYPFFLENSFIWDYIIGELQLALNITFLLPFWRRFLWKLLLKGDSAWTDAILLFTGYCMAFGNVLSFRGRDIVDPDTLTLSAFRTANRGLYVHPDDEDKRLWVVNTHLTATAQSKYDVEQQQIEQIESVLEWMENAVNDKQCPSADAMVICVDLNASPGSKVYNLMIDRGFKSCACDYIGRDKYWTYESLTWTYVDGIDEEYGDNFTLDYIWIKPLRKGVELKIEDCRIVGKNYKDLQHRGKDIRVYPSDHFGVFVKLTW